MVKPVGNKLLLQQKLPEEGEEVTKSGIVIQRETPKKQPIGKIIAKGELVPEYLEVGMVVFFEGWNGEPVPEELGGMKGLLILGSEKVIATYAE